MLGQIAEALGQHLWQGGQWVPAIAQARLAHRPLVTCRGRQWDQGRTVSATRSSALTISAVVVGITMTTASSAPASS